MNTSHVLLATGLLSGICIPFAGTGKPKTEKKEKTEGPTLSDPETIVAFTVAGNAKSIMDVDIFWTSEPEIMV